MSDDKNKIWFPAKRYGWGWGPPVAWQGWLVLIVYAALLLAGADQFRRTEDPRFFLYLVLITAVLVGICWHKGERPRWRWGNKDRH